MSQVTIVPRPEERKELVELARSELQIPRDQAWLILRQERKRRGMMHSEGEPEDQQNQDGRSHD